MTTTITQEIVSIPLPDEPATPMQGYLARPSGGGPHPTVIVTHELFGVNADMIAVVDHLASRGWVALAIELYHRRVPAGTVFARDDAGRDAAFELLHGVTRAGAVADVDAAMRFLDGRADTAGRASIVGFSFGGHVAYLAATQLDLDATVVLYGGWLTGTEIELSRPAPTLALTPGIAAHRGRVLFLVGDADHVITSAQVDTIESALVEADVPHRVVRYPGAAHAFFWDGTPAFDGPAREDAWRQIEAFLR